MSICLILYVLISIVNCDRILSVEINCGLGNQMFQIASSYGLSKQYGFKFIIDPKFYSHSPHSSLNYLI